MNFLVFKIIIMYKGDINELEKELKLRGYSPETIKSYTSCVDRYFDFMGECHGEYNEELIKTFLLNMQSDGKSGQTVNLYLNAIKFYYREVRNCRIAINIKFSKKSKKLPIVLTRDEIQVILDIIKNKKHKLIIALTYGAGLRISEVVKLKVKDIDFVSKTIHLKCAKGKKDRITVLPGSILLNLIDQTSIKSGNDYVFESNRGGALSKRTVSRVFEQAVNKVNIKKDVTFHSLRHSFATQLVKNGVDTLYIQKLLGHSNIKTTQLYTQVASVDLMNVLSPL